MDFSNHFDDFFPPSLNSTSSLSMLSTMIWSSFEETYVHVDNDICFKKVFFVFCKDLLYNVLLVGSRLVLYKPLKNLGFKT